MRNNTYYCLLIAIVFYMTSKSSKNYLQYILKRSLTDLQKLIASDLDHVWVGGRTEKTRDGWRWFDETGKALSPKGIGVGSSWCLGENEGSWPKADADSCLNLDREGHGLPLFYGLQCDFAKQHVLCGIDHGSRSLPAPENSDEKKEEANINKADDGKFPFSGRRSFGPGFEIHRKPVKEDDGWKIMQTDPPGNDQSEWSTDNVNEEDPLPEKKLKVSNKISLRRVIDSTNDKDNFKFLKDYKIDEKLSTNETEANVKGGSKTGIRIADLDEDSKNLLAASGYNFTNNDLLLGLEMELVDLTENSTVVAVKKAGSIY